MLRMAGAAFKAVFAHGTMVSLRCADLHQAGAVRGLPAPVRTARWLGCPRHQPLLRRCTKALEANAGLREAHAEVAGAVAASPSKPCLVLVDDAHLLAGRECRGAAERDADDAPLGVPQALATLLSVWQCPGCVATAGTSHADAAGPSGGVCAILTATSLESLPRELFPLPHSVVCQASSYVDSGTIESRWLPAFLQLCRSRIDGPVAAPLDAADCLAIDRPAAATTTHFDAHEIPHVDLTAYLSRSLTVDRPPLRMALRAAALRTLRHPSSELDASATPAPVCCPIDLVLRIQAPAEVRRCPEGLALAECEGTGASLADAGTAPTEPVVLEALPADRANLEQQTAAGTGGTFAAAASSPFSAPGAQRSPLQLEEVVCCASAKAEALRSIVLPLLAWQQRHIGLRYVEGDPGCPTPAADVASLARAMVMMRVAPPTGLLLHGPPGSGKSTLAIAIARAARMRLLVVDAALLLSRFVGDSEASIRRLFRAARAASPCCLVIENLEMVGGARAGGGTAADSRAAAQAAAAEADVAARTDEPGCDGHSTEVAATATDLPESVLELGRSSMPRPKRLGPVAAARKRGLLSSYRETMASSKLLPRNRDAGTAGNKDCSSARSLSASGGSAAGPARGAASVHDRMLATLLTEMDGVGVKRSEAGTSFGGGFTTAPGASTGSTDSPLLLVVGVSEHRSAIDPALLRPGRLDRHIFLPASSAPKFSMSATALVSASLSPT